MTRKPYTPERAFRVSVMPLSVLFMLGGMIGLILAPDADEGFLYIPPLGSTGAKVVFGAVGLVHVAIGAGMLRRSRLAWHGMFAWLGAGALWNLALAVTFLLAPPGETSASPVEPSDPGALFHFAGTAMAALVGIGLYIVTRPAFACPLDRDCAAMRAGAQPPCDPVFDSCIYMGGSRDVPWLHPLRMAICPDAVVFRGVGITKRFAGGFEVPLNAIIGVRRMEWSEGAAWDRDARAPGFERLVRLAESREPLEGIWNWVEIEWRSESRTRREAVMFALRRPFPWFLKSRWRRPEPLAAEFCRALESALPDRPRFDKDHPSAPDGDPGPAPRSPT